VSPRHPPLQQSELAPHGNPVLKQHRICALASEPPMVADVHVPMQQSSAVAHWHSPSLQRLPSAALQLGLRGAAQAPL